MPYLIDTRGADGTLVILGDALILPQDSGTASVTIPGALRYNPGTASVEVSSPSGAWIVVGSSAGGSYSASGATAYFDVNAGYGIAVAGSPLASEGTLTVSVAPSGVAPGTYNNLIVDDTGRIVSARLIDSSDITTALGYVPAQAGASGVGGGSVTSVAVSGGTSITVAGSPITTSGTFVLALSDTGVSAGSYNTFEVGSDGRLTSARDLTSGDVVTALGFMPGTGSVSSVGVVVDGNFVVTGSPITGSGNINLSLATTGVTPGTYDNFAVDNYGRLTQARSLTSSDIETALGYVPAASSGTTGGTGSSNSVVYVNSISDLRALTSGTTETTVNVAAHTALGDGGGGLFDYNSADTTSPDNGGTVIVDAAGRRWYRQFSGPVNVRWFGASGNGTSDDTASIQTADAYARAISNAEIFIPAGTYAISQLTVYSGSNWCGEGPESTVITKTISNSGDALYGVNSDANWSSSSPSDFVIGCSLRNFQVNGNWNDGSGTSSGSGIAIFGARLEIDNVWVYNCATYGIRTEYSGYSADGTTFAMEGFFRNIKIDTAGQHGWLNAGPHDSVYQNVIIIDAGQAANATYDGLHLTGNASGRYMAIHPWSRSGALRMQNALFINSNVSGAEFGAGCNFEGSYNTLVCILGQFCVFDSSVQYYAAENGVSIYLGGPNCAGNVIRGSVNGPANGAPACAGLVISNTSSDYVADNTIDLSVSSNENGNVHFGVADQGNNVVDIHAYNATSATYYGTPNPTSWFRLRGKNSDGRVDIDSQRQRTTISIAANSSATWTFPFPFSGSPIVVFSVAEPSGTYSSGVWMSSGPASSYVEFYNNNAVAMTLHVFAMGASAT